MRSLFVLLALALAACQPPPQAKAPPAARESAPVTVGALTVENASVRPPPGGVTTGAGYMTIRNAGAEADRLVAASSPAAVSVEMHTHRDVGGVMRMERVVAVEAPANGAAVFRTGGLHLMLFGLKVEGETVPVTLRFERAGEVTVNFVVSGAAGGGQAHPEH